MTKLVKLPRAEQWADRICTQMGKSVESIIEVGRLLVKAKSDLEHGEWGRMFEDGLLPFTRQTAHKLMTISQHPQISNVAHVRHLPPHWGTLYELTKAEPAKLKNALKDGVITPDMPRKDVKALQPAKPASKLEPHHWMIALADLRKSIEQKIEQKIETWPIGTRRLVPQALRDLADILDRELDVDRRQGADSPVSGNDFVIEDRPAIAIR